MTGMGICGMEGVIAREDHNYRHGIREGERRMLRLVFIGAACAIVIYDAKGEQWCRAARCTFNAGADPWLYAIHVAEDVAGSALRALRDLGDEDASRVLGERGW